VNGPLGTLPRGCSSPVTTTLGARARRGLKIVGMSPSLMTVLPGLVPEPRDQWLSTPPSNWSFLQIRWLSVTKENQRTGPNAGLSSRDYSVSGLVQRADPVSEMLRCLQTGSWTKSRTPGIPKISRPTCTAEGHAVASMVEPLYYKPEIRGFDSRWGHWFFSMYLILLAALGPGVYSASNINEYQNILMGIKRGRRVRLHSLTTICEPIV
jgi:hypothetical protein